MIKRRSVLAGLLSASLTVPFSSISRANCVTTSTQPEGPFYPINAEEQDNDLTRVVGGSSRAAGEVIRISGQVRDGSCSPIAGSLLEIWQANSAGRYFHPQDTGENRPLDPNFQGYAKIQTDNFGRYSFVSIKPGSYKVTRRWTRPPHIHFRLTRPQGPSLTTQMYFADQALNETDYLLGQLNIVQKQGVTVKLNNDPVDDVMSGIFDITLA
ncbi:MAG: hypothetical protein CMM32_11580 [Rhodospirillaceae bacterium]|nr:hypothetical protein [Rhodospirillaceae bacterium]